MSAIRTTYLFLYNIVQWAGWFAVLADRVLSISSPRLTENGTTFLYFFQCLAVMEVLHSLTGLVRASFATTLVQVLSRVQLVLVHYKVQAAQESSGLVPMVLAWGLVEVVRYLYLALNLVNMAPKWLLWLRYTLFYVLYPLGVYGEMEVLSDAMPSLASSGALSVLLPNEWNFSFSFSCYVWVLLYIIYLPGLYVQYSHMMKQRSKALSPPQKSS